jgi:gamma-glutamyl:cysteine ligase YbdK (ATP-grasp superfamily)
MSDQVPEKYRGIFTNEEWVQHQFVVWGSWIFVGVAFLVHVFIIAGGKTYLPAGK